MDTTQTLVAQILGHVHMAQDARDAGEEEWVTKQIEAAMADYNDRRNRGERPGTIDGEEIQLFTADDTEGWLAHVEGSAPIWLG